MKFFLFTKWGISQLVEIISVIHFGFLCIPFLMVVVSDRGPSQYPHSGAQLCLLSGKRMLEHTQNRVTHPWFSKASQAGNWRREGT